MDLPRPFGPFLLEAKLGQGGMAEVFRARVFGASGFEKQVVIKTLRAELIGEPDMERMFLEEVRLQARLSHQNLVQAHELGVTDGRPWARLDLVDGVDLATLGLPLATDVARLVVCEVALGLHALHEAKDEAGRPLGIVHRDVSPRNVLVSKLGEVRLADFGIARATRLKEQTRAGVRKGTAAYMSPEQVSGRPLSDASDQFSLGTLAVEVFTGARPFDADTYLETLERIREAAPPVLDGLDSAIADVLRRALRREPRERYPSVREFRAALRASGPIADELSLADLVAQRLRAASPNDTPGAPQTRIETSDQPPL